jgi:hypothetical protein
MTLGIRAGRFEAEYKQYGLGIPAAAGDAHPPDRGSRSPHPPDGNRAQGQLAWLTPAM